jgi:DNA-binding LacI/PurR family transcriptional regulator
VATDLAKLDFQGGPKYKRLKSYLVGEMAAGRLKPGELLPSEPELATALSIARTTVRQALAELQRDGLVRRVQGTGTFVEDDVARRIRRGTDIFGLVVMSIRTGYHPELLRGFESAAREVHHQTLVCPTGGDLDRQCSALAQLRDKNVGGVALVPNSRTPTPAYQIRQLRDQNIPVVYCHRPVEGVPAPLLAIPFEEVGRRAGQALLDEGHRRIGYIGLRRTTATEAYLAGLRTTVRQGGGDVPDELAYQGEGTPLTTTEVERSLLPALEKMCSQPDRPTGLMMGFDAEAEVAYLLIKELGLRIPEDISLVSFGGTCREGAILNRLTSVVVDEYALGQQAGRLLYEMRSGKRPLDDRETVMFPLSLCKGTTLGPAPERR